MEVRLACSLMGEPEIHTEFWLENLKEGNHSEDLRVDGNKLKMDVKGLCWEGMGWIQSNSG